MRSTHRPGIALVSVALAALAAPAAGTPARSVVVSCGDTITQSVKLSADLNCPTGIGLAIGANKIVLDLGGHTITGNTSSNGIVVQNYALVTIKNGTVSGFYDDVALQNAPETVISGIEARVAAQNGIVLTSSDLSTLTKVKVVGSQHNGIYIDSDGVSISKSTVSSSLGGSGIDLLGTQDIVTSVSVFASVGSGIVAEGPGEQILKSTVQGTASGASGIHLINSSFGLVSGTTVTGAGSDGILVDATNGVSIVKNTVTGAGGSGINFLNTSSGGMVGNKVNGNAVDGIRAQSTSKTAIGKNTADLNGTDGISAQPGDTDLGGNTASDNGVEDCTSGVIAC